ncbi:MAG: hypothetical protein ABH871_04440 [Pseudomonadota bacterium]
MSFHKPKNRIRMTQQENTGILRLRPAPYGAGLRLRMTGAVASAYGDPSLRPAPYGAGLRLRMTSNAS